MEVLEGERSVGTECHPYSILWHKMHDGFKTAVMVAIMVAVLTAAMVAVMSVVMVALMVAVMWAVPNGWL